MSLETFVEREREHIGARLTGIYTRVFLWYLLAVALLWVFGVEGVYKNVTPFYALFYPAFGALTIPATVLAAMWTSYVFVSGRFVNRSRARRRVFGVVTALMWTAVVLLLFGEAEGPDSGADALAQWWTAVRWHLLVLAVFIIFLVAILAIVVKNTWFEEEPSTRSTVWLLLGTVVFLFVFSGSVAMIRGGPEGISQAYERHTYEYVADIGIGGSIRGLFRDYLKFHPHLSLHAKAHPPGAVTVFWVLSYVFGRTPMGLSLATMCVGALGILPLYGWVQDMIDRRTALTCCALYALMPSIVLFTATSADIVFATLGLTTLFLFWRALHRNSVGYGVLAGVGFAACSLTSFTLLSLGAFFGLAGLWRLRDKELRAAVVKTAVVMIIAFFGTHLAVRLWSGFDAIACFKACKAQFDLDQLNLDKETPRYAGWVYRFLNPASWFYFAGIPVSVLFVWRLVKPEEKTKSLFIVFLLTLLVLNLLYLGRGEGERSALYVFPFVVVPAGHLVNQMGGLASSCRPMAATLCFLAFQCWFTESYFYTYW